MKVREIYQLYGSGTLVTDGHTVGMVCLLNGNAILVYGDGSIEDSQKYLEDEWYSDFKPLLTSDDLCVLQKYPLFKPFVNAYKQAKNLHRQYTYFSACYREIKNGQKLYYKYYIEPFAYMKNDLLHSCNDNQMIPREKILEYIRSDGIVWSIED